MAAAVAAAVAAAMDTAAVAVAKVERRDTRRKAAQQGQPKEARSAKPRLHTAVIPWGH